MTSKFGVALGFLLILLGAALRPSSAADLSMEIGAGHLDVVFSTDPGAPLRRLVSEWVATAARAVTAYYGRFPVDHATVRIRITDGNRIESGRTFGTRDGGEISLSVGGSTTAEKFHSDWMMTHEMVHLAFPSVAEQHHWMEEGLATYVEPIARVRIGNLRAQQVWSDLVRDLPQGLPEPGDRGLDFTPTWARTYWGGALFCFLADVEIRRRTLNAHGLEDGLRAILEAGGSIEHDWELERALGIGDQATGVPVLKNLYDKMRADPSPVDLETLWKELGVERQGQSVRFDDKAPLAAIRKAIMPEK